MIDHEAIQALKSAASWLERWASHVGNCAGGMACTCGLTAIRAETETAITAYHAALPEVEVGELVERLKAEVVIDAGDGPFVELWEVDRDAAVTALVRLSRERDALVAELASCNEALVRATAVMRRASTTLQGSGPRHDGPAIPVGESARNAIGDEQ